jgi:uncharacterized protein with ATP-grasp and redox domains
MNTQLECIPCFIRQALEASQYAGGDDTVQKTVLRAACRWSSEADLTTTPPAMGQRIHRLVRELTGNQDPYAGPKSNFNRAVLELLPNLRQWVATSPDPFATAVRLAIAGNAIDLGAYDGLDGRNLRKHLVFALECSLLGSAETLQQAARAAANILYIADNAGEIVLDRLLIEQLESPKITVVVRGYPVLNDATRADATAAGLDNLVEVIDNGSDAPGTVLADCSTELRHRFDRADMVIVKGQGNYETLSHVQRPNVFFLLMAKCPVVARHLGCEQNSFVLAQTGWAGPLGRTNSHA